MKANKLSKGIGKIMDFADKHQREILLGCTIVGVISTGITAWRNAPKAQEILESHKKAMDEIPEENKEERRDEVIETVKEMAPLVAPPVLLGGLTIAAAIGGHSASSKQIAALSAAYSISEKALTDYMDKAKEVVGDKKAKEIKDKINEEKAGELAPSNSNVLNTGNFHTPCFDVASGRYFYSSAEKIRQACNNVNHEIMDEYFVSLNELYNELGLPPITLGEDLGFTIDGGLIDIDSVFTAKPMEINGSTEPVLIFNIDEYISTKYMENRGRICR